MKVGNASLQLALAVFCCTSQVHAQVMHSPVYQTDARRSAAVTYSSGKQFSAELHWHYKQGMVIDRVVAGEKVFSTQDLSKINGFLDTATFLDYIQIWCSGNDSAGMRIAYITASSGNPAKMQLELQITKSSVSAYPFSPRVLQ